MKKLMIIMLFSFLVISGLAQAQPVCNNSDLNGRYSFSMSGGNVITDGYWLNFNDYTFVNVVGVLNYNGHGKVSVHYNLCANGSCAWYTSTGTYSIDADCTGNQMLGGTESFALSVAGSTLYIQETQQGGNFNGTGRKQ